MAVLDVPVRELQGPRNCRAEFLFHGLLPARSKLAPGGDAIKDLVVVFNHIPALRIIVEVNASLDIGGNLRIPSFVGKVFYMCFQPP